MGTREQCRPSGLRGKFSLQVLLKGSSEGDPLGFLGYCPQENGLWPNLTVREHLDVFAAVKGLRKADATVTITRYEGRGWGRHLSLPEGSRKSAGVTAFTGNSRLPRRPNTDPDRSGEICDQNLVTPILTCYFLFSS